jgi:hypothetical protein
MLRRNGWLAEGSISQAFILFPRWWLAASGVDAHAAEEDS